MFSKICPENIFEIGHIFFIFGFLAKSTPNIRVKILQNLPIFCEFLPENPDFFLCDLSEALISAPWTFRQGATIIACVSWSRLCHSLQHHFDK